MCFWSEISSCGRSKCKGTDTWNSWPEGVMKEGERMATGVMRCVINSFMEPQFFHPIHRSPPTDRRKRGERDLWMGSEALVPGTGRDTLPAERGGGAAWVFFAGGRSRGMLGGEWDWMDGGMDGRFALYSPGSHPSLHLLHPMFWFRLM